jgi:AcrR family transcriptional regulator
VFGEVVKRRPYRLGKRAERAADTRRRIIEATLELHDRQGISRTTVRDVAGWAAVAPSTVLQHFPRMDELIRACGELSDQLAPMPTEALLADASGVAERVQRMATAMFEWWETLGPGFDHLRIDRRHIPQVDAWLEDLGSRHRRFAATALQVRDSGSVDLLVALTTADAWSALRAAGATPRTAGSRVAQLIGADQPARKEAIH